MAVQVVILAAGLGKRMYSNLPKMMHYLAGKPLLQHVIQTALAIAPETQPIVIYGHQGKRLQAAFSNAPVTWVEQTEQLGTGHAVLQALPVISATDDVLILCGDVPLVTTDTLQRLIEKKAQPGLHMVTATVANPGGYGRIIRNAKKQISKIVEEKDATAKERAITEINPDIYYVKATYLKKWLPLLSNHNAQNEYYLTDIIKLAVKEKLPIYSVQPNFLEEIFGVNDRLQLATLERVYQKRQAEKLMQQGVTIYDPNRFDIRGNVKIGRDVIIDVNVILEGNIVIGDDCVIGPNTLLREVKIGARTQIKANSILEEANVASDCVIGPFARIRPGTMLANAVHVGNFVELKNSSLGNETKVNHLSYIGDSEVGQRVNIGAGTITCNYDGVNKHKTVIGDEVHVGSDTQLVAPVSIGDGATIGAGSTITKDVPARQLTVTHRLETRQLADWQRPHKKNKK